MSLYHEAAEVLNTSLQDGGSIKSIVFSRKDWKRPPKALFALATEAAKWSEVLSEVIENAGLLGLEKDIKPVLSLLLTHDLLLAKKGLALPPKHGLRVAIERHKARLSAELTKARLRRGCTSLEALKAHIDTQSGSAAEQNGVDEQKFVRPRWIRINTLRTSLNEQLESTFSNFQQTKSLSDITNRASLGKKLIYIDANIPDLIAVPPNGDFSKISAHKSGALILQDKASCFPAYLLEPQSSKGDIIDACAAPGNKTTHLAALIAFPNGMIAGMGERKRAIIACERNAERSKTLESMVRRALPRDHQDEVRIKAKQDFLKLDPKAKEFENVTALLLDPSCSGSGIIGRDESCIKVHLPRVHEPTTSGSKKRKRKGASESSPSAAAADTMAPNATDVEEVPEAQSNDKAQLKARLEALSSLQLRLLEHAMAFPRACRITYSTCSLHAEENEHVVARALRSTIAQERGWRVLRREKQVPGLRKWTRRGDVEAVREAMDESPDERMVEEVAEACIRCEKGGEDGTMGFFVCAFVREGDEQVNGGHGEVYANGHDGPDEDEWDGFED